MMKLATLVKSRGSISGQLLDGAQDVFMGSARFSTVAQKASTVAQKASTFAQNALTVAQKASTGGRIFAPFKLYKGKAAFNAEPVAPTFTKNEAGDQFVKRSGFILLTFSPSIGERKYDWQRKQVFAMSPTEVGSLISLGPGGSCDFFHDPGMQTSNAGEVRKSLQVKGNPDGNYLITLNVVDKVKKLNEYFAVQATPGEFAVIRTSFSFALPHIMGWDRYSNRPPPMKAEYSSNSGHKAEYSNTPPPIQISRKSIGTVPVDDKGYGEPVQKAEAMAFRTLGRVLDVLFWLVDRSILSKLCPIQNLDTSNPADFLAS